LDQKAGLKPTVKSEFHAGSTKNSVRFLALKAQKSAVYSGNLKPLTLYLNLETQFELREKPKSHCLLFLLQSDAAVNRSLVWFIENPIL